MKKQLLKSMLVGVMTLAASGAWAADPDLENDYTLVKSAVFGGAEAVNIAGSGACSHTAYDTGNKKQQSLTILTAPEDAAGWIAMQAWTDGSGKGWWNRANQSLYCVNAQRSAAVFGDDLTTGWLVVFDCKGNASAGLTLTDGSGNPDGTFNYTVSEDGKSYFCTITAETNAYVGFCGVKNSQGILKISVYKPNKAVVKSSYTVNYVDLENNTLKESVTYDAVAGSAVALTSSDKANIVVGEDTYVYDSDNSEGVSVAEDGTTTVTVKFHLAANFSYTVNEMCGGTVARSTTGVSYETADVKVPFRVYNVVDGKLYKKGQINKEFNYGFKLTVDNQVENLDYAAVEGKENVVFITEGEDIEGMTKCNSANCGIRSSNSSAAYAPADVTVTTLPAGKYQFYGIFYDAQKTPNSNWTIKAGAIDIATINCTTINYWEAPSVDFAIGKETPIIIAKGGGNSIGVDALYIVKTGDVTPEEAAELNAAAAMAEIKAALQEAIAQATALNAYANDADLATAIDNATAALADDAATLETLGAAGMTLNQKATAAAKTTLQTAVEMAKTFGVTTESVTAGEALLKEDATAQELGAALQAICNDAVPAAKTAVSEAKSFFNTFDKDAAADLADEFTALETALEGTDINKIKTAAQALFVKATPAAKTAIGKVKGYLEVMKNETITQDLAALQAAMDNNDFPAIIAAAKKAKDDLTKAVPTFLTEVKNLIDAGKKDGKNGVDALETAYNAAQAAIITYATPGNNGSIVPVGEAIYNLVKAVEAYEKANKPAIDLATVIVNPNFEDDEAIATKICTYAKDVQEGQFAQMQPLNGWTIVENGDARAAGTFAYGSAAILGGDGGNAPAAGPNGETEGKALGLEAVWTATALYTQDITLPAGEYLFEAVIYNGAGTAALASNLIGIDGNYLTTKSYPVGQWTTDQVKFTLAEEKAVTVSVGVTAQNVGNGSAPHLFIDHVKLYGSDEIAAVELATAKENALATIEALLVGDALFLYNAADIEAAKTAVNDAKTVDEVNAAVAAALAAQNKPDESKAYAIANKTAEGNLSISEGSVTVANDALVHITAVDGGYVLSNDDALYIFKTTSNTWTFSTTANKDEAYIVNFNYQPDGTYTISGANGLFGTDNTTEGSTVWANKKAENNGYWTITEVVITEDEALQAAKDKLQAEITAAEALKTDDRTKGRDEFNAAIDAATAALTATNAEVVIAALQALKTAEQTFLTANAPLAEGVYYVYNAYSKKFLSRGAGWGTQAVGDDYGLPINVTADKDSYKLQMVDNGAYYGDDFWMYADCSGDRVRSYTLEATEGGFYLHNTSRDVADNRLYIYLKEDENKWNIAGNAILNENISDEAQAVWQFLTQAERDEIVDTRETAEKAAAFMGAGIDIDAKLKVGEETELTFATGSAWTFAAVRDGSTATTNDNGTEVFQGTGTFTQAVEGLESGLYKVSIQAFYRDGENAAVAANYDLGYNLSTSYLNVNGTNIAVKSWGADRTSVDSPNGMDTAAALFADGKYFSEGYAYVADDGKLNLTVYVPSFIGSGWFIAGNVKYAKVIVDDATGINELQANGQKNVEGAYTISGQKVQSLKKGLYIINGKKVVKK